MHDDDATPDENAHNTTVYQQLCENYRAVDQFRTNLLALLPFATAAGVLVLLNGAIDIKPGDENTARKFLGGIGAFGFLVTLGLFSYELHGIKKCGWLIRTGSDIEKSLHIRGPFETRPNQVAGLIDEPFAASVIYPASLAAWVFLALAVTSPLAALVTATAVFIAFFCLSLSLIRRMEADLKKGVEYEREPRLVRPSKRRAHSQRRQDAS